MNLSDNVVYQIYIKSFNDSNNDGIGDLNGITEKLDYLKFLGIDYIWITPFFKSPQNDNGYDIENYYEIDPIYGTMEDFNNLMKKCKEKGIKVMLDMVFNHTSTNHQWFKKAISGDKNYQDFYIFNDKKTNWLSKFGGSAWEFVSDISKYYLHLFDKTQADLNWKNEKVREELYKVVQFWMDKGVDGFRFDVVNLISKPNIFEDDNIGDGRRFYTDGPKIHKYLKELNKRTFGSKKLMTVGEMSSTSIENCIKYAGENENELSQVFSFHHLKVDYKNKDKWQLMDFDFIELKNILSKWQLEMQKHNAWNALFWCNHDQPRIVSRFGDDKIFWNKSAKTLATSIHLLRGVPYIYQGEEIGMTNTNFDNIDKFIDIESHNYYNILINQGLDKLEALNIIKERSRDNGRTPVQWNSNIYAGFSESNPWISVIDNYKDINVEKQLNDKNSILNFYRQLIKIRKENSSIVNGKIEFYNLEHSDIFMYKRINEDEEIIVICNFYPKKTKIKIDDIDGYELLLTNSENKKLEENMLLNEYDTYVYKRRKR